MKGNITIRKEKYRSDAIRNLSEVHYFGSALILFGTVI